MCITTFVLCPKPLSQFELLKRQRRRRTCDWFSAGLTLLSVQVTKALEAVRAVVSGGEVLPRELCRTVGAHKTLLMPRLIPIGHATFGQGLKTQVVIYPTRVIITTFQFHSKVFTIDSDIRWPFYSGCTAGRTCPRSRPRSSVHPCQGWKTWSRWAVRSCDRWSSLRATSSPHTPASSYLTEGNADEGKGKKEWVERMTSADGELSHSIAD